MSAESRRGIAPGLSLYMDMLRFMAAISVMLGHVWPVLMPRYAWIPWPRHDAVIVFFVISGLVIAHASEGRSLDEYFQHRALRIYSVALPAIAFALFAASVLPAGFRIAGSAQVPYPVESAMVNLIFCGQLWWANVVPAADLPYWSLNFEVWYYIIFAAAVYMPGRWRPWTVAGVALVAGPKILLLMVPWLLGVAVHKYQPRMSGAIAAALFAGSSCAAVAYMHFGVGPALMAWTAHLGFTGMEWANNFIGDWILGAIVALNFVAAANLPAMEIALRRFKRPIRTASSFTFSIYLYHVPTFALLWYVVGLRSPLLVFFAMGIVIAALGQCTERQLPRLRRMVKGYGRRGVAAGAGD